MRQTDLAALGDKPFFAFMLSTTNHLPFEFPDGRIELYEQPKQTQHNAIKYADFAIGEFFGASRKATPILRKSCSVRQSRCSDGYP